MVDADPERAADVIAAMTELDRRRFLPPAERDHAHEDRPLPLGHGQTNSQPSTVSAMLRLLEIPVGARVLDLGSGSGWTTALLARLVGPAGSVVGVELEPELAELGARNLAGCALSWARIEPARPGVLGRPIDGGYDRILVSAAARDLPAELVDQLGECGRMVLPIVRTLWVVQRDGARVDRTRHGAYRFVPLRSWRSTPPPSGRGSRPRAPS